MTTFARIHTFLPFTLGRAVFQFDKTFQRVTRRWNVIVARRKSIFLRARKRREQSAVIRYRGMRIFAMFLDYSWKSDHSSPPIVPTFVYSLERRELGGERLSCKKNDGWPRDGVLYNIGWNNILRFWEKKKEAELLQRSCPAFNGIVTRWKLFSRIKSLVDLT